MAEIDAALSDGDMDGVARAQHVFAETVLSGREPIPGVSVTEEGSVLHIEL